MRFELTQPNGHYPLKVACLPIPPPGHLVSILGLTLSEKRDSNPRPQPWQGCALPTELFSRSFFVGSNGVISVLRCKGRDLFFTVQINLDILTDVNKYGFLQVRRANGC